MVDIQSNFPMDPVKKAEIAELLIEAVKIKRWFWVFFWISLTIACIRIAYVDSLVMIITHILCIVVMIRGWKKSNRKLNEATRIFMDEVERYHEAMRCNTL